MYRSPISLQEAAHSSRSRLFRRDRASRTSAGLSPMSGYALRSARAWVSAFSSSSERAAGCAQVTAGNSAAAARAALKIARRIGMAPPPFGGASLPPEARCQAALFARGLAFALLLGAAFALEGAFALDD